MKPIFNTIIEENVTHLHVLGDITVQYIFEFKQHLRDTFDHNLNICLNLSKTETLDISGIQLLLLFNLKCNKSNLSFTIELPTDENVTSLIYKAGLQSIINLK